MQIAMVSHLSSDLQGERHKQQREFIALQKKGCWLLWSSTDYQRSGGHDRIGGQWHSSKKFAFVSIDWQYETSKCSDVFSMKRVKHSWLPKSLFKLFASDHLMTLFEVHLGTAGAIYLRSGWGMIWMLWQSSVSYIIQPPLCPDQDISSDWRIKPLVLCNSQRLIVV